MRWTLALVAVAACVPHHDPVPIVRQARTGAGIAIALYTRDDGTGYSVVDDRRSAWVKAGELELDDIDPGAALASLVIEPLDASAPHLGACARPQLPALGDDDTKTPQFAPVVRCRTDAAPGKYPVRVVYVSSTLAYRAQHDIAMTAPGRATVTTRFAIVTPAWRTRADVVIYDGMPGGDHPPRELARGQIALDGATAIVGLPAREVGAELRRVYDGAVIAPDLAATDSAWGHDSIDTVGVWLELAKLELSPGAVHVHLDLPGEGLHEQDLPATARRAAEVEHGVMRLPLWTDTALRGIRERSPDFGDGAALAERFLLSVANLGDAPREVWIEEHLRPARHRRVERAWPSKPTAVGDRLRSKVVVKPGRIERVGYTIAYDM